MLGRVMFGVALSVLLEGSALAQTGQINGVVTDNTGGVVPGATVKAVEAATGLSRDTVSGADGRYTFTSLRPTTYDITAELTGFRTSQRKGVVLQANQNLTVNFALELGNLAETVTVSGEVADRRRHLVGHQRSRRFETHRRAAAERPRRREAEHAGRGHGADGGRQESGKTIPGALRLSTNGTESRQVSFRLDGTSHTDPYFQQNQPFPFPDALQEFSIQTSNYSAAQGNSAGAVVNAVTRSGTNDFHGGAFGYLRDRTFNARNFFSAEKDFLKRQQSGGFLGGPIQHNKTFFFVGWQGTDLQNVGTTQDRDGADGRAARRQLRQHRRPGSADRPAVPEQPDSAQPVRSGVGERAEVHAAPRRRRPHPDSAARSDSRTISSSSRSISCSARRTS